MSRETRRLSDSCLLYWLSLSLDTKFKTGPPCSFLNGDWLYSYRRVCCTESLLVNLTVGVFCALNFLLLFFADSTSIVPYSMRSVGCCISIITRAVSSSSNFLLSAFSFFRIRLSPLSIMLFWIILSRAPNVVRLLAFGDVGRILLIWDYSPRFTVFPNLKPGFVWFVGDEYPCKSFYVNPRCDSCVSLNGLLIFKFWVEFKVPLYCDKLDCCVRSITFVLRGGLLWIILGCSICLINE